MLFGRCWAAKSPWLEREGDLGRDLDRKVALARATNAGKEVAPREAREACEASEARCQFCFYRYIVVAYNQKYHPAKHVLERRPPRPRPWSRLSDLTTLRDVGPG